MDLTWENVRRGIGILSGAFGIISFAFPEIPDSIRYTLLAIAGTIGAYYVFKSYVPLDSHARAYRSNAQVYGFMYELLNVHAVMGEDGSARISRRVKLKSTSPELGEVEHYLMVPGLEEEPEGAPPLDAGQISCEDQSYNLTVERQRSTPTRLNFFVKVRPPLSKRRSVEYTISEAAPPGTFLLTRGQLRDGMEHEFFAWQVSRPTKEMHLEINIPASVGTQRQEVDVWPGTEFGDITFSRATPEFHRVQDSSGWKRDIKTIKGKDYVCCELTIRYPVLGLRYVIKWIPRAD